MRGKVAIANLLVLLVFRYVVIILITSTSVTLRECMIADQALALFGRPLTLPTTVGPPGIDWKEGIWFLALAASSCLFVQMLGSPPLAQYLSG